MSSKHLSTFMSFSFLPSHHEGGARQKLCPEWLCPYSSQSLYLSRACNPHQSRVSWLVYFGALWLSPALGGEVSGTGQEVQITELCEEMKERRDREPRPLVGSELLDCSRHKLSCSGQRKVSLFLGQDSKA